MHKTLQAQIMSMDRLKNRQKFRKINGFTPDIITLPHVWFRYQLREELSQGLDKTPGWRLLSKWHTIQTAKCSRWNPFVDGWKLNESARQRVRQRNRIGDRWREDGRKERWLAHWLCYSTHCQPHVLLTTTTRLFPNFFTWIVFGIYVNRSSKLVQTSL